MTFPSNDEIGRILDDAVEDVFVQMLATPCQQISPSAQKDRLSSPITAALGFAGMITGLCSLTAESDAVMDLSGRMMGMPVDQIDETALDALGELCNMICGGWKNRIHGMDSGCALAIPTVIEGHEYHIHTAEIPILIERTYLFAAKHLYVSIRCDLSRLKA
jgi:chemotaxis protein CheX